MDVTVRGRDAIADGVAAGALAAVGSGAPSTLHALLVRASPLEATLAAGTLLLRQETRPLPLVLAAIPAHLAISLSWGVVLALTLPRRWTVAVGGLSGLGIAALDLGVLGARFPRIRALPLWPQVGRSRRVRGDRRRCRRPSRCWSRRPRCGRVHG